MAIRAEPTRAFRAVQALLSAAAAAALAAWATQHLGHFGMAAWSGAAAACVGATLGWQSSVTARAGLSWTGSRWELCRPPGADGGIDVDVPGVAIDFGNWMLLRVRPPGGRTVWLEASEGTAGPAWPAWRAAVYSSALQSSRSSTQEQPPF